MDPRMPCSITDGLQYDDWLEGDRRYEEDPDEAYDRWRQDEIDGRIAPNTGGQRMLIGITGKAGAGKDTIGDYLRDVRGFAKVGFAWPIKQMLNVLLDVDDEAWKNREWRETPLEEFGRSPRYLAQTLGTEWGRDRVSPNIWINLCLSKIRDNVGDLDAVICDVRFDNEALAIKNAGGYVIDVRRLGTDTKSPDHTSEVGIRDYNRCVDYVVSNYGSVNDLQQQVEVILEDIKERQLAEVQGNDPDAA